MGIDPATATGADPGWDALAQVAAGQVEAFSVLVETHQERLLRLCERILGDAEEARDAAQDVFLKAYRKAGEVEPRGQVYTWLYRVAVNHCLNKLRRRRLARFLRWADPADPEAPEAPEVIRAAACEPPDRSPDPAAVLEAKRRWRATREAIDALPAGQRSVLILARFEGLSYQQIAEVLQITEGAVESRLFRAMRRLSAGAAGAALAAPAADPAAQETAERGVSPIKRTGP